MPLRNYGVWKGIAAQYYIEHREEDKESPHLSLYFDDGQDQNSSSGNEVHWKQNKSGGKNKHHKPQKPHPPGRRGPNREIPGLCRAAINIQSGDKAEKRLAYWVNRNFNSDPMVNDLAGLDLGFRSLNGSDSGEGLDFIRKNLFNVHSGRLLPHDIPGPDNDLINVLEPEIQKATNQQAEVYIFGDKFTGGDQGLHNVHMNQGNMKQYKKDDGTFQDGGLLIHYPSSDEWIGVFLGFASQSVHTNDDGHAIGSETWADYLSPESQRNDLIENSVSIEKASWDTEQQKSSRPRKSSVTLSNMTDHKIPLSSWKVKNSAGQIQNLPQEAKLDAKSTNSFALPDFDFSKIGDTITLLNERGLKVDGVSYNSYPRGVQSQSVVFAH